MLFIIYLSYIFLIRPLLEAKAEIQKYFCWFFGSNSLDVYDPLQTLYQLISGRLPIAVKVLHDFHECLHELRIVFSTLPVQIFRWPKNQPLLIYPSRCLRDSQEPKTKMIFQFLQGIYPPFLNFFLHKSLIWETLGQVREFSFIAIFIMLQKNGFGQKKFQISCTGSKVPFWQKSHRKN